MTPRVTIKNKDTTFSNVSTIEIDDVRMVWYELAVTNSTMDFAGELVRNGCSPWILITAEKQLSGRGTHGREWISPRGKGLLLSLVVPPPCNPEYLEDLSVRTASVVAQTLKKFCNLPFAVKPPNDVRIRGRKVAGIVIESVTRDEKVVSVILGIGINLYQSGEDFERAGLPDATSLHIETEHVPERERLLETFLIQFKKMYEALERNQKSVAGGQCYE